MGENAKSGDPKSSDMKGCLDVRVFKKIGITAEILKDPLAIFQLLSPLHNPKQSDIENDGRMPYFTTARPQTNSYEVTPKGWGGRTDMPLIVVLSPSQN